MYFMANIHISKYTTRVSLGLVYLTRDDIIQFHPLSYEFHEVLVLNG